MRVMKLAIEGYTQAEIPLDHPIIPWLVESAAWTLNRYEVGKDGKTAYERAKGKPFELPVAEFAEKVTYLKQKKKSGRKSKLGARTAEGIFLGINPGRMNT